MAGGGGGGGAAGGLQQMGAAMAAGAAVAAQRGKGRMTREMIRLMTSPPEICFPFHFERWAFMIPVDLLFFIP
jgi:hypothetical protein